MTHWQKVNLGHLCNFEKGNSGIAKTLPGNFPLVTTGKDRKTSQFYQFDIEAVCIPLVSSTGHGHASLKYVHYQTGKFALGTILVALTPKDNKTLNIQFLHLYLSRLRKFLLIPLMSGAANVSLSISKIKTVEIVLPSIKRQIEIVELFNSTNFDNLSLSTQITHQQSLLKKLRQAVLQEAIEGKLTKQWREENPNVEPASVLLEKIKAEKTRLVAEKKLKKAKPLPPIEKDETPFVIPETWEWYRLGEITNIVRGGSPRPAGDKRFYDGEIPFLKVADLTKDNGMYVNGHTFTIKEAGLHKTRFIKKETLMLTNSGATLGIPKICNFPTTFNDGIAAFIYMNNELYKPFFYYLLKSKTDWFLKEASRGQGQPNLNTDIIGNTIIYLPPLAEQKEIVKKVDQLFTICDDLEAQINDSKANADILMQAVLKEAFEQ